MRVITLGGISYCAAALGFALLTLLLLTSWHGRQIGMRLIAASGITALWAALLAIHSFVGRVPAILIYTAEIVRDAGWLYVLTGIGVAAAPRWLRGGVHALWPALLVAGVISPLLLGEGADSESFQSWLSRSGLVLGVAGLILLEQIYRNAVPAARTSLRYLAIAIGSLLVYDVFLYSQAEMTTHLSADFWNARGLVNAFAVPFIALAVRRNPEWSLDIFVSRQVVFYTTSYMAAGTYLVVMALGGYLVRDFGGSWGAIGQVLFFSGAAIGLATLIASGTLRRRAKVFISKHFYRNKYDYRIEWLRFIGTLSSTTEDDVRRTSIHALAQIFSSPGGVLFTLDDEGRQFVPVAAWPIRIDALPNIGAVAADGELARFLEHKHWIIDLREYERSPDIYQNIELPSWLGDANLRIVSPILQLERLAGFFVLYEPPPPFELTYEDRDLMKTVGRHVATHIAQHDADRKLAESRQFEAYNRLTAFMMHDLKNSVAQLQLIVVNAARHKHNPEFIDDSIETIANAVDRMTRLIEQLRSSTATAGSQTVSFKALAQAAVERCSLRKPAPILEPCESATIVRADPERLGSVIEHIIRNAQDASLEGGRVTVSLNVASNKVSLTVADTGQGMAAEFVRERLFRPFDSTKGSKGMGIGAYQAREYVRMLGGHVEVQSSPGLGTAFSITLPLASDTPPLTSDVPAAGFARSTTEANDARLPAGLRASIANRMVRIKRE